jgi:SulP family sulfate permease
VLLALLVLAPLFSALPKPVLAALIIEAVVMGMMDLPEMRRMRRVSRVDFWVAVAAILGTLVFGILAGVAIGIALSMLWLVYVATHPEMPTLGRERGTQVFRDLREHPEDETFPGVVAIRVDGGVFFATAEALQDQVRATMHSPGMRGMVLHFAGVNFVDSQGTATVAEIVRLAEESGVDVRLASVRPAVRMMLESDGVIEPVGADRIHGSAYRAVAAHLSARGAFEDPPDEVLQDR